MKTEKTTKEWLSELPDGYRERALANMDPKYADYKKPDMGMAISDTFSWANSPEGYDFWFAIQEHFQSGNPLPPLRPHTPKGSNTGSDYYYAQTPPDSGVHTFHGPTFGESPRALHNRILELENEVEVLRARNKALSEEFELMTHFAQSNLKYEQRVVTTLLHAKGFLLGLGPNHPGTKELLDQINEIYENQK